MIGWDSDLYVLLSIGKIPLLLQKWKTKSSIKNGKKAISNVILRNNLSHSSNGPKQLRNGCIKQKLAKSILKLRYELRYLYAMSVCLEQEHKRLFREKTEKLWDLNELCIWKKKKNDGFWKNRGFEISRDYISERQKNLGL